MKIRPITSHTCKPCKPQAKNTAGSSNHAPGAAPRPVTGEGLLRLLQLPEPPLPRLVDSGAAAETRRTHRRMLATLLRMGDVYKAMSAPVAIVEWLDHLRKTKKWAARTMLKYMASTSGALSSLPLYRRGAVPFMLNHCPEWRAALLGAAKLVRKTLPKAPLGATRAQVVQAIQQEISLPVKAALILAWVCAARTSDIWRLQKRHVTINSNGSISLTYLETKTAKATGPRSLTTAPLPTAWLEIFRRWYDQRNAWLFPEKGLNVETRTALRRVDPRLECRSLRRGALSAMAEAGVPSSVLLEYSGHTSERMLRVYLGWGRLLRSVTKTTAEAGAALA
jgi:integrase